MARMARLLPSLLTALALVSADHVPFRYSVDLGVDPTHRWDHVVQDKRELFATSLKEILADPRLQRIMPLAKRLIGNELEAKRLFREEHYFEAEGIARELRMDIADIIVSGVFYDLFAAKESPFEFAACSGIVAQSSSGEIMHGRNLDYMFRGSLANMTLIIDFVRDGKVLFTGVTLGPSPLFNTGVRWGSFSVTQNERNTQTILSNLWDVLVLGRPALFGRIREAHETLSSFKEAVDFFSDVKVSAAAYFIVGGTQPGEGAVITRGRDRLVDVVRLNASAGAWYVAETNYDHTSKQPFGDDRLHPLIRGMNAAGPDHITPEVLWDVLSITDVNKSEGERAPYNAGTVYSTVMQASQPSTFKTLVRSRRPRPEAAPFVDLVV